LAKSLVAGLAGLGLVGVVAGPLAPAALAESGRFELTGPDLRITVTRAGKELPLGAVPSLAEGDILHIAASLPGDQSAHLMVVSAFLRGATNPPPREWIGVARTWRDKPAEQTLTLTVPKGARQMVVLVVPDTRGAQGALVDAVRGKPGEFVRASQDLNQASLDHARLDAFIAAVRADSIAHPQGLRKIAPVLAHSLSIKLNEDCLDKIAEQQASCLVENREALVLNDVHTSSLTETLAGAPTDLALTVSATAAAGAGLYSPYIGVVRDLARVLGAFSNPQFSYLPTLAVVNGPVASLRLNTAPSFSKPKSVMVMAMPAIGADSPPQLRSTAPGPLCARSGPLVLPVEGAPLIFATGYAHDMSARLTAPEGKQSELDVTPRPNTAAIWSPANTCPRTWARCGSICTDAGASTRSKGPISSSSGPMTGRGAAARPWARPIRPRRAGRWSPGATTPSHWPAPRPAVSRMSACASAMARPGLLPGMPPTRAMSA
jgi:hypothetical protein